MTQFNPKSYTYMYEFNYIILTTHSSFFLSFIYILFKATWFWYIKTMCLCIKKEEEDYVFELRCHLMTTLAIDIDGKIEIKIPYNIRDKKI